MTEIYLDSAATSLHKPPQVARAVAEAICTAGNAARGVHGASMAASRTVYDTRCLAARLLGCPRPDHVAFTANSTMALNMAICGLLTPEDHAVSTDLEHNSVLRPLYALERQGMGLSFLPADGNGRLDYDALEGLFRPNTRAVVCTHASNVTGDMPDIPRIAALAHAHGALLILDASQTAGAVPLDMTALGADVLCFTGHKSLLGPQGTGGLCIRPGVELRPLLRGGSGVHSFDPDQPAAYPTRLDGALSPQQPRPGRTPCRPGVSPGGGGRESVRPGARPDAAVLPGGPGHSRRPDIRRLFRPLPGRYRVPEHPGPGLRRGVRRPLTGLGHYGIATRPGAHCAPRLHRALGTERQGIVRFSFSPFNTPQEIDTAVRAVADLAR